MSLVKSQGIIDGKWVDAKNGQRFAVTSECIEAKWRKENKLDVVC